MDEAIRREYGVRVGFEDTLILPDGRPARSNAELVAEAVGRVRARSSEQLGESSEQSAGGNKK